MALPLSTPSGGSASGTIDPSQPALPMEYPFAVVNTAIAWEGIFLMEGDAMDAVVRGVHIHGTPDTVQTLPVPEHTL